MAAGGVHQTSFAMVAAQPNPMATTFCASAAQPYGVRQLAAHPMSTMAPPTSMQMASMPLMGTRTLALPSMMPRGPVDLLVTGAIISENEVSADHLIASGNLIEDYAAEAALLARFHQIHGNALASSAVSHQTLPVQYEQHALAPVEARADAGQNVPLEHQSAAPMVAPVASSAHRPTNCEWMFNDVATGWLGIHALAHLNPLRWSGPLSFEKALQDLEDVRAHDNRPIIVKVPANTSHESSFANAGQAIDYIRSVAYGEPQLAEEQRSLEFSETAMQQSYVVEHDNATKPTRSDSLTGAAARLQRAGFAVGQP